MVVTRDYFRIIAYCLRHFEERFPNHGLACSLREQADALEEMLKSKQIQAACWNQTSVNCDMWKVSSGPGRSRKYNLNKDKKHRFLFPPALDVLILRKELGI